MNKEEFINYLLDDYENSLTIYYDYDVFDLDNEDTLEELYEDAKQMMKGGE